jgi:hypothetical protein
LSRSALTHRLVAGAYVQGANAGLNRPIVLRPTRRGVERNHLTLHQCAPNSWVTWAMNAEPLVSFNT